MAGRADVVVKDGMGMKTAFSYWLGMELNGAIAASFITAISFIVIAIGTWICCCLNRRQHREELHVRRQELLVSPRGTAGATAGCISGATLPEDAKAQLASQVATLVLPSED
ncbi:Uncharacterized protein PBTT_10088 [Plasmodiophora brassicae]